MRKKILTLGAAEKYLMENYGVRWSRPYLRKLIKTGKLRGEQLAERGWWYTTEDAIDDLMENF